MEKQIKVYIWFLTKTLFMKRLPLLFAFISLSLLSVSCSSDGGDSAPVDTNDSFLYTNDGTPVTLNAWQALRSEDTFEVQGETADGASIYFRFDAHGNLDRAGSTPPTTSSDPWLNSFADFTSNYFNFDLVSIDEATQMVKVTYSGKLYEEEYDLNSTFSQVSGEFNLHYTNVTPAVPNMHFTAKIDGDNWYGVKSGKSIYGFTDVHLWNASADAYQFDVNFNSDNLAVGTYPFTAASTQNRVVFSKYNTATNSYVDYISSGTFTVTEILDYSPGIQILSGSFNITAVNPIDSSDVIQVTQGSFKTVYLPD
jgi:hypothetical protein